MKMGRERATQGVGGNEREVERQSVRVSEEEGAKE